MIQDEGLFQYVIASTPPYPHSPENTGWDIYVTVSFIFENRMSKEQWSGPEKIFDSHNFSLKLAVFVVSRELFPLDILFFSLGKLCP